MTRLLRCEEHGTLWCFVRSKLIKAVMWTAWKLGWLNRVDPERIKRCLRDL